MEYDYLNDVGVARRFLDASAVSYSEAVRVLRENGWLETFLWEEEPLMQKCAVEDNVVALKAMIDCGWSVNAPDSCGDLPLGNAVSGGALSAVRLLLDAGANPNAIEGSGVSVLWSAVASGDLEIVEVLLRSGARCDAVNPIGHSIAEAVAQCPAPERMTALLRTFGWRA